MRVGRNEARNILESQLISQTEFFTVAETGEAAGIDLKKRAAVRDKINDFVILLKKKVNLSAWAMMGTRPVFMISSVYLRILEMLTL